MPKQGFARKLIVIPVLVIALLILTPSLLYHGGGGEGCTRCHEIRPTYEMWTNASHREIPCSDCHGSLFTADPSFHATNLRRLIKHYQDEVGPQVLLVQQPEVDRVVETCRKCHRQQFADWQAGPHSATYADIFLNEDHNSTRLLMGDCFRCHGMHFQGSIEDLVEPVSTTGPWTLKRADLAAKPVIPCLTCHEVHRHGEPRTHFVRTESKTALNGKVLAPSLALFDRRTQIHVGVGSMTLPVVMEGERSVQLSEDQRQALCYQCHATRVMDGSDQAGTGDDRTAMGVHEGLSCLSCHATHDMRAVASCATCHPRFSNCGMSVDKLISLFDVPKSPFDIHTVDCIDCHPKGVPPRRNIRPLPTD
jgi:decaheme cytochrome c component MtrC/MtrF-like protein/cytochrome c554/c'-like protein